MLSTETEGEDLQSAGSFGREGKDIIPKGMILCYSLSILFFLKT